MKNISYQELEDKVEAAADRYIRLLKEAERRTCADATESPQTYGEPNAHLSGALGYAQLSKMEATKAGLNIPGVQPNFGGGK